MPQDLSGGPSFYEENRENMDFALYNTPVIDFTRWKEEAFSARKVLGIVTGDRTYGKGLRRPWGSITGWQFREFPGGGPEEAEKKARCVDPGPGILKICGS